MIIKIQTFPQIAEFKNQNLSRLIDEGTYFFNASLAGGSERYARAKTPHTIHVWWARRPFSAMRPLVFASLCRSKGKHAQDTMHELASLDNSDMTEQVRELIGSDQRILDMFGGGGTIPISAYDMGIHSYSMDIR